MSRLADMKRTKSQLATAEKLATSWQKDYDMPFMGGFRPLTAEERALAAEKEAAYEAQRNERAIANFGERYDEFGNDMADCDPADCG